MIKATKEVSWTSMGLWMKLIILILDMDLDLIPMIPMPHKAGIDPNDLNARYDPNDPSP